MADRAKLIQQVREKLGDFGKSFRQAFVGDDSSTRYDLPVSMVSTTGLHVYKIVGTTVTDLTSPAGFTMDYRNSVITLPAPLPSNTTLMVEGTATGLFSDDDLGTMVDTALAQHTSGADESTRYRDVNGFIRYARAPVVAGSLPELEEPLVVLLATIDALWSLAIDASTDIDIYSAEGTNIPRHQRWQQLQEMIELLTERYKTLAQQLNVGLYRVEILNLRRVSKTTGRLIPLYVDREYDDNTWPIRILPPIDARYNELDAQSNNSDVAEYDIALYAGDTYSVDIDLPVSIVGHTVKANIQNSVNPTSPSYPLTYTYVPFTVTVLDAAAGTIRLSLTSAQTAALNPVCKWDLQDTDGSGNVTTYLRGLIRSDAQVTL